jgi:hypothetical protein
VLKPGQLGDAFQIYWQDMERCRTGKAYWSLLHVTVCLPDICAALQSANGESTGRRYIAWCDRWLVHPALSGAERWSMRCKVLHQGRAFVSTGTRYTTFAFGQPDESGAVDHMRPEGTRLHLDVGALADEAQQGVGRWIEWVETNRSSNEACNVEKHLPSLVRVAPTAISKPAPGGGTLITIASKTN